MDKTEIITLIENLLDDAGLDLDNDKLIKVIANRILEIQDDVDVNIDEIVGLIIDELPDDCKEDDEWYSFAEELAAEVLPMLDQTCIDDEDED